MNEDESRCMMEKQMIFHILGIEETKEEDAIRAAYRACLKHTNPEDDPEGFKRLREAYEEACAWAREPEEAQEEKEKTEIEGWIDKADAVYTDIVRRRDPGCWKELFADPVFEGLDTSLDAREALIGYLASHIYLPQAVWQVMDDRLQILEDMENLKQMYPENFLEYMSYYIQNREFINYQLFQIRKPDDVNVDGYINHYMGVKRKIDAGTWEGILEELADLPAFGVYHPYEEVERLRILTGDSGGLRDLEQGESLAERLLAEYPGESYVLLYAAEARWEKGRKEEAFELWNRILEQNPAHYMAGVGAVRYWMDRKEYARAKEKMMDLLEMEGHDELILDFMETANKTLIQDYKNKMEGETKGARPWKEDGIELAWCLFQNEHLEEAVELLESMEPEEDQEYSYCNLFGRVLYKQEAYEKALPYLKRWLELIQATVDDGTAEQKKRISRLCRACHILGGCYYELGQQEEAERYVTQAVEAAKTRIDRISCLQYLGYIQLKGGKYEHTVDVCDRIIEEDLGYFPAYVQRQEAYYELKKGQQVVDDYHRAVEIYPGYYKPYLLAAQVFFFCDQYEDAKGVLDRARENKVEFSKKMKLFEIKILRNLADSEKERKEPMRLARELLQEVQQDPGDVGDPSEVEFEIALLCWDNRKHQEALAHLQKAIEKNKQRHQYWMVKGHVLRDTDRYKEALAAYQQAEPAYGGTPGYHYNLAICQEELGMTVFMRESLERVTELQEGYEDSLEKLADIHWDMYRKEHRRADLEKALDYINRQIARTENCYYLVHRGLIYMEAMEIERALGNYKQALVHSPEDWAAFNNMGYSYKILKEYETSIAMYQSSIDCFKDRKNLLPYSNMADVYEILGQYEKAIECYRKDLEWFPDRSSFWEEIGDLYCYMGNFDEARKAYKKIGDKEDYLDCIKDFYYRKGMAWVSLSFYRMIIWREKEDKAERWYELGDVYRERRLDYRKAISCYRKAIRLGTDQESLFRYEMELAAAYYGAGKLEKARDHARKALEAFRKSGHGTEEDYVSYRAYGPIRLGEFGNLYLYLGETEKGLAYLERMGQGYLCKSCRYKGCYEQNLFLGRYYEHTGQLELALQEYEKAREYNSHSLAVDSALQNIRKVMGQKS